MNKIWAIILICICVVESLSVVGVWIYYRSPLKDSANLAVYSLFFIALFFALATIAIIIASAWYQNFFSNHAALTYLLAVIGIIASFISIVCVPLFLFSNLFTGW
jgi:hypothetical protein